MITDITETAARRLVRSDRCGEPGCEGRLAVAWGGAWGLDQFIVRCGKNPTHKATKPDLDTEGVKMTNAGSTSLVRYDTPMGEVEISVEAIRKYLNPKATVEEAYIFLQKCRYQRINPFLGEAYLVVYPETQNSPRAAQIIIGKEAHTRRAERHPDYIGMSSGVIVHRGQEVIEVPGAFLAPGDVLLGSWARVLRKGKDPSYIALSLKEYDTGRRQWKQMPATMIRKCAITQALREAFPSDMAGLQGSGEFDLAEDSPPIVEGQVAQAPAALRSTVPTHDPSLRSTRPEGATATRSQTPDEMERDLDDLFPGDAMAPQDDEPPVPDEPFDPALETPLPLPEHVTAMTHLDAVLKDNNWTVERLQAEILNMPLATYLRSHTLDQAYQLFKAHQVGAK